MAASAGRRHRTKPRSRFFQRLRSRSALRRGAAILPVVVVALAWSARPDEPAPRPAEQILADIAKVESPGWMEGVSDEEYDRLVQTAVDRKIALIDELRRDHPDHPSLPKQLLTRWTLLRNARGANEAVLAETSEVLESGPPAFRAAALYARAYSALDDPRTSRRECREWANAALAAEPPDEPEWVGEWKVGLFWELAWNLTADPAEQKRLIARVLKELRAADGARDLVDLYQVLKHAGETPELAGDDMLGGPPVALSSFRGRPTIVVFLSAYNVLRPGSPRFRAFEEFVHARETLGDDAPRCVGVLIDRFDSHTERFLESAKTFHIDFPVVRDPNRGLDGEEQNLAQRLRISHTPCFLWLDDQGRIERVCGRIGPLLEIEGD